MRVALATIALVLTLTAASAAVSPEEQSRIEEILGHRVELVDKPTTSPYRALVMLGIGFVLGAAGNALYSRFRKNN